MFERFTPPARQCVVRAQEEARELRHGWIGCEHLLLGVLAQAREPGAVTLHRLGVTPERFREQLAVELSGCDELGANDSEALRSLGIDLDEIRRRVEEHFGPGALDKPLRRRRSWLPWRRRNQPPWYEPVGHIPFTPRAKKALELALRQAIARKDRHIGVEHVVLGLLMDPENLAVQVLTRLGIDPKALRTEVLADLDQAA